ncbi:hypothetical protein GCM10023094_39890 [Rhodococcus olei]|uniref:Uncharacterized protein n=1 Tax=Rhodococcus olei TaxID=2161675 RepID=A0ABP8PFE1_9NOCA
MKALRVDVDGAVDLIDLTEGPTGTVPADLRKAIGVGGVEAVPLGEIGRITTTAEYPERTLYMWVDENGALGATGLQVNLLVNGLLSILGGRLAQNIYGPVVFTEANRETGETVCLQEVTSRLLQGILFRLTIDNLDVLAGVNRTRRYTAVAFVDAPRNGVEILDTSIDDDVRRLGFHDFEGSCMTPAVADEVLAENGWERSGPWGDAEWLYDGESAEGQLSAPIRKK